MEEIKAYFWPYIISNILFALCIVGAVKKPWLTRVFLAGIFLWASYVNSHAATSSPQVYLEYGKLTFIPFYQHFINGFFSRHIHDFVYAIATGQFLIFIGLSLYKTWVRIACAGGFIFGLAIAPLGIGAAFPATICMAISFFILFKRNDHDLIWKWKQYKPAGNKNDMQRRIMDINAYLKNLQKND